MAESTEPPLQALAGGSPLSLDASTAAALTNLETKMTNTTRTDQADPMVQSTPPAQTPTTARKPRSTAQQRRPRYTLPLPVRTFPLPTVYPGNPLSLVYLAVAWLGQVLWPWPATGADAWADAVYEGTWSAATRSVQVTDARAMDELWCRGFFGKGSLSRSEPSWLQRERARRSVAQAAERADGANGANGANGADGADRRTSEQRTNLRREARADTKWERGRIEFEALEHQRQVEEAAAAAAAAAATDAAHSTKTTEPAKPAKVADAAPFTADGLFRAPVGPLELLALPNSDVERRAAEAAHRAARANAAAPSDASKAAAEPTALSVLPMVGVLGPRKPPVSFPASASPPPEEPLKRSKSVRFSPTVASTTFVHSDPPSPHCGSGNGAKAGATNGHAVASRPASAPSTSSATAAAVVKADDEPMENKEHLQLAPEEAFFLAYAVGALRVRDAATGAALSAPQLLTVLRRHSYFPPREAGDGEGDGDSSGLSPDDPFLVQYAVYHHFRSLGWVPRHGIKFGVDWLLYGKGPALDHAEFGVLVMPSYTAAGWRHAGQPRQRQQPRELPRSWHWLHCANRVLTTVFKSLVLVYVDIPAPDDVGNSRGSGNGSGADDIAALLGRYQIREVMVRRWSSNRNRG